MTPYHGTISAHLGHAVAALTMGPGTIRARIRVAADHLWRAHRLTPEPAESSLDCPRVHLDRASEALADARLAEHAGDRRGLAHARDRAIRALGRIEIETMNMKKETA